jgi:hypothetical protein
MVTEHPQDAFDNGWSVRSFAVPAEVMVKRQGQWVWLDDFGYVIEAKEQ